MTKLLCGLLAALAVGIAAPARAAPVAIAVYHPADAVAAVQTVQYYPHYRPHGFRRPFRGRHPYAHRFYRHPRPFYHRGPPRPGFGPAPFRRY